jgi:hypothetical protein
VKLGYLGVSLKESVIERQDLITYKNLSLSFEQYTFAMRYTSYISH